MSCKYSCEASQTSMGLQMGAARLGRLSTAFRAFKCQVFIGIVSGLTVSDLGFGAEGLGVFKSGGRKGPSAPEALRSSSVQVRTPEAALGERPHRDEYSP